MANVNQRLDRKGAFAKADARRNMPALPRPPSATCARRGPWRTESITPG
jgi:hypothetical protein